MSKQLEQQESFQPSFSDKGKSCGNSDLQSREISLEKSSQLDNNIINSQNSNSETVGLHEIIKKNCQKGDQNKKEQSGDEGKVSKDQQDYQNDDHSTQGNHKINFDQSINNLKNLSNQDDNETNQDQDKDEDNSVLSDEEYQILQQQLKLSELQQQLQLKLLQKQEQLLQLQLMTPKLTLNSTKESQEQNPKKLANQETKSKRKPSSDSSSEFSDVEPPKKKKLKEEIKNNSKNNSKQPQSSNNNKINNQPQKKKSKTQREDIFPEYSDHCDDNDIEITLSSQKQYELLRHHKRSKNYFGTAKLFNITPEEARAIVRIHKVEFKNLPSQ